VSQGEREKKFLMPDLIGKRASVVIEKLKELEFNIGHIRYSYYPGLDSGIIINQYPEPGSRIQRRNLITMEVSK
jgi:beta-lactam-binding protein with PASTA domain